MKNNDEDIEIGWRNFLNLCLQIKSIDEFRQFFDLFLTLDEKETIGKRYLIVKALEEGKLTQRELADKYKLSISQVTRGSNALKIISKNLRQFLKKQLI